MRCLVLPSLLILTLSAVGCGDDGRGRAADGGSGSDGAVPRDGDPGTDGSMLDADVSGDADPGDPDGSATDGSPADGAVECTGGLESCGGECVDLESDDARCGSCSTSCMDGTSCVAGSCVPGVGALVIAELHAMEPSYFELYNGGSSAIDLDGHLFQWSTEVGTTGSVSLPSHTLGAGDWVVLREGTGTDGDGVIHLGEDVGWLSSIAVRLLAPGGVGIDFVRTGSSTVDPPTGTAWTGDNADNPSASLDQSLVRNVYVPDTDSAADWSLTPRPSPGDYCALPGRCGDTCYDFSSDAANCGTCGLACSSGETCVDGACVAGHGAVWISEYRRFPRPMVEVHNPTADTVTMTGYKLDLTGGPDTLSYDFPEFTLAPGAFVSVFMGDGIPDGTSLFAGPTRAFGEDVAISLYDDALNALDFVRFGASSESAPTGAPWFGDNVPAVSSLYDDAARRDLETLDTNSNADWILAGPATPGFACHPGLSTCDGECRALSVDAQACGDCGTSCAAQEACVGGACASVGAVVISEIHNGSPEGIEIYNGTDGPVDLEGWTIAWSADGGNGSHTVPAGVSLAAGDFLYFREGTGAPAGDVRYLGTNVNWDAWIAVTLSDDGATARDFVRTGDSVSSGTWTGDNALNPTDSLARHVFSADTDSAADWYEEGFATPGTKCPSSETVCGAGCADLDRDPASCGRCGNSCGPGGACYEGDCVFEGAIRLLPYFSTDGPHAGLVNVFHDTRWHDVYTVSTSSQAAFANVVCRQLGYPAGTFYSTSRYFACPGSCGSLVSVTCTGTEASLLDCSHSVLGSEYGSLRVVCTTSAP